MKLKIIISFCKYLDDPRNEIDAVKMFLVAVEHPSVHVVPLQAFDSRKVLIGFSIRRFSLQLLTKSIKIRHCNSRALM